jgi:hypothetical protein
MGHALTGRRTLAAGAILTLALSACGGPSPQKLADDTTRAVYAGDRAGTIANFDDQLKPQVTRAQVGAISDAMHMLGDYKGLQMLDHDGTAGRYDFVANFDKGTMLVMVRMDSNGQIGAYRVSPAEQQKGS